MREAQPCCTRDGKDLVCVVKDDAYAACVPRQVISTLQRQGRWAGHTLAQCERIPEGLPSLNAPPPPPQSRSSPPLPAAAVAPPDAAIASPPHLPNPLQPAHKSSCTNDACVGLALQCAGAGFASAARCCGGKEVICLTSHDGYAACVHERWASRLVQAGWEGETLACGESAATPPPGSRRVLELGQTPAQPAPTGAE